MNNAAVALVLVFFLSPAYTQTDSLSLDYATCVKLSDIPLQCVEVEYPNKLGQVLTDSTFIDSPANLHPVFYGCFDWHSAVHGYWLLARVMNKFPESDQAKKIERLFDKQFTAEKVAVELAYFEPKLEKSFERTYGWAWLLKLQEELIRSPLNVTKGWSENMKPLVDFVVESYKTFLPKLIYPVRVGEHTNTAFGLSMAIDYANIAGDTGFYKLLVQRSKDYFLNDTECPVSWEPSGFDFISPCLQEAELMSKILHPDEFETWLKKFLPALFKKNFELEPGRVIDRTDGKLVHLDGLNFSRAFCFYSIARALPSQYQKLRKLGDQHLKASMNEVIGSDYMGSHWLATFLVYALEKRNEIWVIEIGY
jgi:hypothetical protein